MVYSDAGGFIKPDYPETFTSEKKSLGWNEGYYRGWYYLSILYLVWIYVFSPLSPHDALKYHFTSLKTEIIFLQLRVF